MKICRFCLPSDCFPFSTFLLTLFQFHLLSLCQAPIHSPSASLSNLEIRFCLSVLLVIILPLHVNMIQIFSIGPWNTHTLSFIPSFSGNSYHLEIFTSSFYPHPKFLFFSEIIFKNGNESWKQGGSRAVFKSLFMPTCKQTE